MKMISKEELKEMPDADDLIWRLENEGVEPLKAIIYDEDKYASDVIGVIGVVKSKNKVLCEVCGKHVEIGKKVFVGIRWDDGYRDIFICEDCLDLVWANLGEVSEE